jgi:hypothetical protein
MTLTEILTGVKEKMQLDSFIATQEIITGINQGFNERVENALNTTGLAFGVMLLGGQPTDNTRKPLRLENHVGISVFINPKKCQDQTGKTTEEIVQLAMSAVHQVTWASRGIKNEFRIIPPGYDLISLADTGGKIVYMIHLEVISKD